MAVKVNDMEDGVQKNDKRKNSNLSVLLIIVNIILLGIFLSSNYVTENQGIENVVWFAGGLTVLVGGYAFSYHGKDYRIGKWIFAIVLIIFLAVAGMLWYIIELGHAFSH